MNNIQLGTAFGATTGTGLLYTPYSQGADQAIWKNGSGATRSIITMNRTKPKPTPTFPGVERLELKTTQFFTVSSVEFMSVVGLVSSVPTVMSQSLRDAQFTQLAMLACKVDPWQNAISADIFPS